MKQKIFTRPISVVLSDEMFYQIKAITDQKSIGISEYIREAIELILKSNKKEGDRI
jgi:Arc/MetJ-type ribon-helix-helix transcriptional regulator